MPSGRLLFIDAYDSFSNSIIALLKSELPVTVETIRIDDARFVLNDEAFIRFLHGFDAVVAGPGPGHPTNPGDVGLIERLWHLPDENLLPVLGICLGFQSLCHAFGGQIERLEQPQHGVTSMITHCGKDIFTGTGNIVTTQYHSLHVRLGVGNVGLDGRRKLWSSSRNSKHLIPLAWNLIDTTNGPTLMSVKHRFKPFWGVQYHPESVCTNDAGRMLVTNWWQEVKKRAAVFGKNARMLRGGLQLNDQKEVSAAALNDGFPFEEAEHMRSVQCSLIDLSQEVDVVHIMEIFDCGNANIRPLLLESGTRNGRPVNSETGRFSIIALRDEFCLQYRYYAETNQLVADRGSDAVTVMHGNVCDALKYFDHAIQSVKSSDGPLLSPFWGGLVGFISYEAGLENIGIEPSRSKHLRPDMWFVFVDRSIVVDHERNVAYIQSIRGDDKAWLLTAAEKFQSLQSNAAPKLDSNSADFTKGKIVAEPQKDDYCQKVLACQSMLRAGESYELCLTDQTRIATTEEPWSMYRRLRQKNPAPFSSFLRMSSATQPGISVVSSSPERFLSWTRQGRCQFRPIKGTVKKSPEMTRAKAEAILGSVKERAENLMIVDLIRHDLNGVKGVGSVNVPKLMTVEEYETVFQLVSVIEGDFDCSASPTAALAASLPPGSMTGAPKKRSCEILKTVENEQPRGLYSGVIGYFDVGGGGDFSVVIRTAFKWDDGDSDWCVGAGGAVTVLSEAEAEWEEMLTKRQSVLQWI